MIKTNSIHQVHKSADSSVHNLGLCFARGISEFCLYSQFSFSVQSTAKVSRLFMKEPLAYLKLRNREGAWQEAFSEFGQAFSLICSDFSNRLFDNS